MNTIIIVTLSILTIVSLVQGHGYTIDPVSRASRWRFGFTGPTEYTDNQLFCGGAAAQWGQHGGKCGVCGDEYGVPPRFAYPGAFAQNPPIVKTYAVGQQIAVKVRITANHKGYFTFRVAPLVNPPIKQEDLDKNVLQSPSGDTQWQLTSEHGTGDFTIPLQLPVGLSCQHCVLQWWYTTGNNYGGINPESFVNCADIAILSGIPPVTSQPTIPVVIQPTQPPPTGPGSTCTAVPGSTATDQWCVNNCALGFCPSTHCICG